VILLSKIARSLGNAQGEVTCTIKEEEGDPRFEFYMIRDGSLCRQKGRLVREEGQEVIEAVVV